MCVEKSDTHCVSFIYNNYIIVKHMNFIHWRVEFKGIVHLGHCLLTLISNLV